jgi:hypothetical protein
MSRNEQSGREHGSELRPEGAGVNIGWTPADLERRETGIERRGGGLSRRGHIKRPVETYAFMKPMPNSRPPADAGERVESLPRVADFCPGGARRSAPEPCSRTPIRGASLRP